MDRIEIAGLSVAAPLAQFLEADVFPGAGVTPHAFWSGFADVVADLGPKLRDLLATRDALQAQDRRLP